MLLSTTSVYFNPRVKKWRKYSLTKRCISPSRRYTTMSSKAPFTITRKNLRLYAPLHTLSCIKFPSNYYTVQKKIQDVHKIRSIQKSFLLAITIKIPLEHPVTSETPLSLYLHSDKGTTLVVVGQPQVPHHPRKQKVPTIAFYCCQTYCSTAAA